MPVAATTTAAGNKQSNITSSYVWGKTSYPGRQTRRQSWDYDHCEYGLFLFDVDIKAADLISYEASLAQKHRMAMSKALAAIIEETTRLLQMQIKNSK